MMYQNLLTRIVQLRITKVEKTWNISPQNHGQTHLSSRKFGVTHARTHARTHSHTHTRTHARTPPHTFRLNRLNT